MKKISQHAPSETRTVSYSAFSGGLNLKQPPENIADNELSQCLNMTFSDTTGRLRTRPGLGTAIHDFGAAITGLQWYSSGLMITTEDGKLWRYDMQNVSFAGELNGMWSPSFVEFGGDLFIASGAKLQRYTAEGELAEIPDSHENTAGVYARAGRLFAWRRGGDILYCSAVGDGKRWSAPDAGSAATDADPQEIEIGYKMAGAIVNAVPLQRDVIIFKNNAVFRLTGEYPEWKILELARDESLCGNRSAVESSGGLFYLESARGLRMLSADDTYFQLSAADALPRMNGWLRQQLDKDRCGLWNLRSRNILLISLGDDRVVPVYYGGGMQTLPALMWRFPASVTASAESGTGYIFIASGGKLHFLSENNFFDGGRPIECSFSTRRMADYDSFFIKGVYLNATKVPMSPQKSPLSVKCSEVEIVSVMLSDEGGADVYGNLDDVFGNGCDVYAGERERTEVRERNVFRTRDMTFAFSGMSPFELISCSVRYVPVGGGV
ncbi:MAG: hypothetical protein Q4C86_10740 [bacterium]|nr:hypothetical protein [bacterium]